MEGREVGTYWAMYNSLVLLDDVLYSEGPLVNWLVQPEPNYAGDEMTTDSSGNQGGETPRAMDAGGRRGSHVRRPPERYADCDFVRHCSTRD